ncbi:MAG TPA: hypothetical protein V6C88_19790 [Chroococcidiopsis sp.]
MRVHLDQSYFWDRRNWGPGEVDIPDDLAIALGLAKPDAVTHIETHEPEPAAEPDIQALPPNPEPPKPKPRTTRKK